MTDRTIAIVGATGRTGQHIVRALAERDSVHVRAVVRSERSAEQALSGGAASTALGDLDDYESLVKAFAGADVVHVIPPGLNQNEEQMVMRAARAASANDVDLFGYHSVLQPDMADLPHHLRKNRTELSLRDTDLPWLAIRPSIYAQTAIRLVGKPGDRLPFLPTGEFSPVDLRDLGEATATVLLNNRSALGTFELAGPDRLTLTDIVDIVRGDSGTAKVKTPAEQLGTLSSLSFSALSDMAAMFAHYESHGLTGSAVVLHGLLGRRPSTFAEVVSRERSTE